MNQYQHTQKQYQKHQQYGQQIYPQYQNQNYPQYQQHQPNRQMEPKQTYNKQFPQPTYQNKHKNCNQQLQQTHSHHSKPHIPIVLTNSIDQKINNYQDNQTKQLYYTIDANRNHYLDWPNQYHQQKQHLDQFNYQDFNRNHFINNQVYLDYNKINFEKSINFNKNYQKEEKPIRYYSVDQKEQNVEIQENKKEIVKLNLKFKEKRIIKENINLKQEAEKIMKKYAIREKNRALKLIEGEIYENIN